MKAFHIFVGLLILTFFPTIAFSLNVTPYPPGKKFPILTGCPFNITEVLWYDVCGTPATGYNVYYNISNATLVIGMQPKQMLYPSQQKMDEISPGNYRRIVWVEYPYQQANDFQPDYPIYPTYAFWKYGNYKAFIKANDTYYLTYDNITFDIQPDFPFFNYSILSASTSYFNAKWYGSYNITPGSCVPDRPLSIKCYFNGNLVEEISPNVNYTPRKEFISTVFSPAYQYYQPHGYSNPTGTYDANTKVFSCTKNPCEYYSPINTFSCNSFDPEHPWLNYWNNIKFKPIYFGATYTPPSAVTLGEEFGIKIDVTNLGLLPDNYTVKVESTNPSVINVIYGEGKIENLASNCPKLIFPDVAYDCAAVSKTFEAKLIPLTAGNAYIKINVTSSTSGITLALSWIQVTSGVKSLSEFDMFGILQIIILSTIILIFWKKFC
jgi:hypothetical protein